MCVETVESVVWAGVCRAAERRGSETETADVERARLKLTRARDLVYTV